MGSSEPSRPAYIEDVDDETGRAVRGTRRAATRREKPKVSQRDLRTAETPTSEPSTPVPEPVVVIQDAPKIEHRNSLDKPRKKGRSTQPSPKQGNKSLPKSNAQDKPEQYGIRKPILVTEPPVVPHCLPIRPRAITTQPSSRPQTVPIRPRAITEQADSRRPKSSYGPPLSKSAYYLSPGAALTYPPPSPSSYFQYAKAPTDYFTAGPGSYNLSEGVQIEISNSGRQRRTSYGAPVNHREIHEKYRQATLYEQAVPLTAEHLKRQQRRLSQGSTGARNGSADEDDEEAVTIKVTGTARVMVGGAEIDCNDGGEIEIKRNRKYLDNRRSEETAVHFGENQLDDRLSRVDRPSSRRSIVSMGPGLYESIPSSYEANKVSSDARATAGGTEISGDKKDEISLQNEKRAIRRKTKMINDSITLNHSLSSDTDKEDGRYQQNTPPPPEFTSVMVCKFCPGSMSIAEKSFGNGPTFMAHFNSAHVNEDSLQHDRTGARRNLNSPNELPPFAAERFVRCAACTGTFSPNGFYMRQHECILRNKQNIQQDLGNQLLDEFETEEPNRSRSRPGAGIQRPQESGIASRRQFVHGSTQHSEGDDDNDETVEQRKAKKAGDNEIEDNEENSRQGLSASIKQVRSTLAQGIDTPQHDPEPLATDSTVEEQTSSDDIEEDNRTLLDILRSIGDFAKDSTPTFGQPSLSFSERIEDIVRRWTSDSDIGIDLLLQLPSFKRISELLLIEKPQNSIFTESECILLEAKMLDEYETWRKRQLIVDLPDTQPEQEISSSQRNSADGAFVGNEDDDTQSVRSDFSNTSSLASIAESIFSHITGSSMSSVAGSAGAGERFVALLLGDSIIHPLCAEALASIPPERFERNLRRMLKEFAVHLRKEAASIQQRNAAHFVRFRARNSAHILCNRLCSRDKAPERKAEEPAQEADDADSEDSSSNESEDQADDLQHLELFIKNSKAIDMLREKLRLFVYPPQPVALAGSSEETPAEARTEVHLHVNETACTRSKYSSLMALEEVHSILAHFSDCQIKEAPVRTWTLVVEVLGIFLERSGLQMPRATIELPTKLGLQILQIVSDAVTRSIIKVGFCMPPVPTGKTRIEWRCVSILSPNPTRTEERSNRVCRNVATE